MYVNVPYVKHRNTLNCFSFTMDLLYVFMNFIYGPATHKMNFLANHGQFTIILVYRIFCASHKL